MAKVLICDTILRDAHQSQAATRMRLDEMLPICDKLDAVGYHALEVWGGATFDSCLRFLNEDPWERLRQLRKALPNTKLQMLLRGQNILGYKHYADDVVDEFVKKSIENGIDIIRVFDALNDTRNMEQAVKSIKKYGGHAQLAMSYTISPVHTTEYFVELAQKFEAMGADSICIKDMANLLLPYDAYELVKQLKEKVKVPIQLHTHNTSGTGDMVLMKAIEAGVDIVDTALSPLGNGTSQPATEPLVATLKGTQYDTGLDLQQLSEIAVHFRKVADRLKADGFLDPKVLSVDINTLLYQVPGGMLSNLISQLKQQNASEKLMDVLAEVPRVREDMGYPPLVTPTSQIVGTQAVLNVLMGERYKMNSKETKGLLRGEYGQLPAPVNEEVRKKIIGDEPVITHRPADDIPPEMDKYRAECAEWIQQEEDVLSYALFPQVALNFFKARKEQQEGKSVAAATPEAPKAEAPAPNYQLGKAIGVNMDVKVYPK
ncbi:MULTISPECIES: oxaloacetate decarboxylase subunit alpha [unclassified Clostridium]|uniref:oxaloacetate decarboxylase subunit alpha n=1 Tax=unclassified Clostridium TaxID=2614128 RepID=UPI000822212D|nr:MULTISPECIES: oxaloacetate decarboxylase subunit alpha [unclassified Clostridium]SCJ22580.1 Methylmalonyl-CoA carboxyltransferase 5S subunit [uncultured Clostridium sp.]